jgi:hypothetical protein
MKDAIRAGASFDVVEHRVIESWITEIGTLLPFPNSEALFYALRVVANDIDFVFIQSRPKDAEEEEEEEEETEDPVGALPDKGKQREQDPVVPVASAGEEEEEPAPDEETVEQSQRQDPLAGTGLVENVPEVRSSCHACCMVANLIP